MSFISEFVRLANIDIKPSARESYTLEAGEYIDDIFFDVHNSRLFDVEISDSVIQSRRTVLLKNNDEMYEHNITLKIKRIIMGAIALEKILDVRG